jgi:hypothetical protein
MLAIQDALTVIRKLIERSRALNAPIHDTIIIVGGTALSAHGIRTFTEDVDLYLKAFSDEAVFQLEQELKPIYGQQFRLDVTATENLWGAILLRDIAEYSPIYQILEVAGQSFVIKTLSIEDLFLVKLGADREKDRQDLPLLAARTTADALIARFNIVIQWHGQRPAVPRFADEFVRQLETRYGLDPAKSIPQLDLSPFIKELLWQAYYPEADHFPHNDPPKPDSPPYSNPAP